MITVPRDASSSSVSSSTRLGFRRRHRPPREVRGPRLLRRPDEDERPKGKKPKPSRARVNGIRSSDRISESEAAYQRPGDSPEDRRAVQYYRECKDAGTLPPIPGAVIITSRSVSRSLRWPAHHDIGLLQIRRSTACSACSTASTGCSPARAQQAGEADGSRRAGGALSTRSTRGRPWSCSSPINASTRG